MFKPIPFLEIFYKTADMLEPQLRFVKTDQQGLYAVSASFMASFDEVSP